MLTIVYDIDATGKSAVANHFFDVLTMMCRNEGLNVRFRRAVSDASFNRKTTISLKPFDGTGCIHSWFNIEDNNRPLSHTYGKPSTVLAKLMPEIRKWYKEAQADKSEAVNILSRY